MFFSAEYYELRTHHRIHVELLAHVTELISKLRVRVYLILVLLSKLTHIALEVVVNFLDLTRLTFTFYEFLSIYSLTV